jgi:hypothetical protein
MKAYWGYHMWIFQDFKLTWAVNHVHGLKEEVVEGSLDKSICGLVLFFNKSL